MKVDIGEWTVAEAIELLAALTGRIDPRNLEGKEKALIIRLLNELGDNIAFGQAEAAQRGEQDDQKY